MILSDQEREALNIGLEILLEIGTPVHALHVHFADRLTPSKASTLRALRERLRRLAERDKGSPGQTTLS